MYIVTYKVQSKNLDKAAEAIAIGQSIGNPSIRSSLEITNSINESKAVILEVNKDGTIIIGYKWRNLNRHTDIAQILCTIQGGQSDIDVLDSCQVIDIDFGNINFIYNKKWKHPTYRPLVGGIIKPKTGLSIEQLLDITKQMCDGGIDWIKEDEILSDASYLPLTDRVEHITKLLEQYPNVMYCFCVNGSPKHYLRQLHFIKDTGAGVHTNFWSGLNVYEDANNLNVFSHFQRSGIRILTDPRNPWAITWPIIIKLAIIQGIDSIHIGMIGGYYPDGYDEVYKGLSLCQQHNRIGTLSCGMNPDIARKLKQELGNNFMANVGGWLHVGSSIENNVKEMMKAVNS